MAPAAASALVAAAIGRIGAMRMALLAERLPATEALSAGLVTAVYPAEIRGRGRQGDFRSCSRPGWWHTPKTKNAINALP